MLNNAELAAANKASLDTVFGQAGQALQAVERLTVLNLQAIKTSLAEVQGFAHAAVSVTNPAELVTLHTAALQSFPQKALAYAQQVKDIFTAATAGQQTAVEAQLAKMQASFLDAVNGAVNTVPGSENAVALAKSAVAAMNNAYEGVNKASKQVANAFAGVASKSSPATIDA